MAKNNNLYDFLVDVADAIREKKGTTALINPQNFSEEILGIESGTVNVERKDVNFYDYDGTLLYSYTSEEAQTLTTLPELPTREGLISQCWNYTLEGIANNNYKCDVGVIYDVEPLKEGDYYDGTEQRIDLSFTNVNYVKLDIDVADDNLMYQICGTNSQENKDIVCQVAFGGTFIDPSQGNMPLPMLALTQRSPNDVLGENQVPSSTCWYNYNHNFGYGELGKHTIRITPHSNYVMRNYYLILGNSVEYIPNQWTHPTQGNIVFPYNAYTFYNNGDVNYGATGYNIFGVDYGGWNHFMKDPYEGDASPIRYMEQSQSLYNANIGSSCVELGRYIFAFCPNLKSISLHSGITTIPKGLFYKDVSLKHVTIPEGVTSIGEYAFAESGIETISLPNSLTSIGECAFENCKNLNNLIVPNNVTNIERGAFRSCLNLKTITLPNSVESIGDCCFESCQNLISITIPEKLISVAGGMFIQCNSLKTVKFLGDIQSIIGYLFNGCGSLREVDFSNCTSVPVLQSPIGDFDKTFLKIIIPDALYDSWIAATNWSQYADNIIKVSEYTE